MDSNFAYKTCKTLIRSSKRIYSPRIVYYMRCIAVGDDRMPAVRRGNLILLMGFLHSLWNYCNCIPTSSWELFENTTNQFYEDINATVGLSSTETETIERLTDSREPKISKEFKASRIYQSFTTTGTGKESLIENSTSHSVQRQQRRRAKNETIKAGVMHKRTASSEMLSRNISIILENLLKSYEQSQLPTHGQGVPTVVRTNILIRSMGPVSELDMEYSMDCYFRQYWRDKRLSFQGPIKSLSLSIKMLDKIWRPDTYFFNGKHSHIHTLTVPNKLLRLDQDGGILYSMRLTIKATCPMELKNFPMDHQSCPLIIGSYGYTRGQLVYEWKGADDAVSFVPGMTLNQFDLISMRSRNLTYTRREGEFSVLHVAFNLKRHTGYFLIQVYVPCILIVVLSWVSFWIHREATSDRVGLCVTAVLTLSTISLDSRTDLPKVKYATALDWFLLMSFLYCIATLLEFAGVHYFTKVGSGEIPAMSEDEWEDIDDEAIADIEIDHITHDHDLPTSIHESNESLASEYPQSLTGGFRKRNVMICPIYNDPTHVFQAPSSHASTMERTTQTEPPIISKTKQMWLCFIGDDKFRKQRERDASSQKGARYINSVSLIDRIARVAFPMSFALFNLLYWLAYTMFKTDFSWTSVKG
uniref:Neurotransmitter-gated ion-channel ligand-binding domain-containing protein n=1 Tax=Glossina austeni TaxID=7395 RepID=A0A1A9VSX5_GLOAU